MISAGVPALSETQTDVEPERLGYDLYRQHGGPDGMGRDMLDTMMAADGKRLNDAQWESFNRPRAGL
jgi:hypothetical protein